ncbi:MAG TPA: cysteine-rich outer membrane protein [Ktedonobacterales bacterium]|nr:cysteine-rich outer membrane protein [Ktedonobacterales bacterium]
MRGAGYGLAVLGVILVIAGLVNHYVIQANPLKHTSTLVLGVGAVIAVVGLALTYMGGRSSGTNS